MITTKHDLCAGTAKLNLNELIKTAQIAVGHARHACECALSDVQLHHCYPEKDKWSQSYKVANAADSLVRAANDLAQATNTLHYLVNAQDRGEIIVDIK